MKKLWVGIVLLFVYGGVVAQSNLESRLVIDPSQIDIVRDTFGVPHIFAQTDPEVAYGLAWAHAEDDFETIQKTFLASKAMLGLYTGRPGAVVDYLVHLLGIRELVAKRFDSDLSMQFKNVLQGYCDGINAYAQTHAKEILVKRCFPIEPQDLISYSLLQLAINAGVETELKKIYNETIALAPFEPSGSNAFAFNSKKTADSATYLAINTHHPLEGQVAWYEAHLSSEEGWNILGTLFPGCPVILIGVNEYLGWTHTVNHPDKLDVYQLEIHPQNPLQYRVDGQWLTLQEKTVRLKVKVPGLNVHTKRKAYTSIYGPTLITDQGAFSIRTGALMDIRALEQWYWMGKSKSYHEFRSALKMEAVPAYNIVYADRYDTIFYMSNARLPIRAEGYNWKGTLPGNTWKTWWNTFYTLEQLPQVLNPGSGYVFNTNHSPFKATDSIDSPDAKSFSTTMGYETHDNNRSLRVVELLANKHKITYSDFKAIKYDLKFPSQLAYPVNLDTLFLLDETQFPDVAPLIKSLKTWNREGAVDNTGATVFAIWFYREMERYEKDPSIQSVGVAQCVESLRYTRDYLLKNFGSMEVALGDYQRLERGSKSISLPGLPDVLASMYSTPSDDGRVKGMVGECYIGLIRFTSAGPEIETVNAFGSSNRSSSRHYDDQMVMFQQQSTKKMTLQRELIYRHAESIYHPEWLGRLQYNARLMRARR